MFCSDGGGGTDDDDDDSDDGDDDDEAEVFMLKFGGNNNDDKLDSELNPPGPVRADRFKEDGRPNADSAAAVAAAAADC